MQPIEPKKVGRSRGTGTAPDAPTLSSTTSRTGICAGTTVLTLDGLIPVEHLMDGDRVITRDMGAATLIKIACTHHARMMYRVAQDGAAPLLLPEGQRVLIRDWRAKAMFGHAEALVPIEKLVDGELVRRVGLQRQTLYQLGFNRPHIIYAGGVEIAASVVRQRKRKSAVA